MRGLLLSCFEHQGRGVHAAQYVLNLDADHSVTVPVGPLDSLPVTRNGILFGSCVATKDQFNKTPLLTVVLCHFLPLPPPALLLGRKLVPLFLQLCELKDVSPLGHRPICSSFRPKIQRHQTLECLLMRTKRARNPCIWIRPDQPLV